MATLRKILWALYYNSIKPFTGYGIGKLYPIKVLHTFILSRIAARFAVVNRNKMFLDPGDAMRLSITGIYEPFETSILKKQIKKGDIVLDIGANIGYYTLLFSKLVGNRGGVYAFEPDPGSFALLKKNVEINECRNVVLLQKAVASRNGKIKLYLSKDNSMDHRIYDSHDDRKFLEIEAIKLDDYFKNDDIKINFIKMDIQGSEGGGIKGMLNLLKKNTTVKMFTEFWPSGLKRAGTDPKDYLTLLSKQGFKFFDVNDEKMKIKPISVAEVLKTYDVGNEDVFTNLLCIKNRH
jgi:FkbM family methyltransferase